MIIAAQSHWNSPNTNTTVVTVTESTVLKASPNPPKLILKDTLERVFRGGYYS